jgi:hypothetical protein
VPARTRPEVRVIVRSAPDVQRQVQALLLLLGYSGQKTRQPQAGEPGADTGAAVTSGRHHWSECHNDSISHLRRT